MSAKTVHVPWDRLSRDQKRRLYWALQSLESFAASWQFMFDNDHLMMGSSFRRFLVNAQYGQLYGYYQRGRNLRHFLGELGCADLLKSVDDLLGTKFGEKTLLALLRLYRNVYLDHASFNPDEVWGWAPRARRIEYGSRMAALLQDLAHDTVKLDYQLRKRYPQAEKHAP